MCTVQLLFSISVIVIEWLGYLLPVFCYVFSLVMTVTECVIQLFYVLLAGHSIFPSTRLELDGSSAPQDPWQFKFLLILVPLIRPPTECPAMAPCTKDYSPYSWPWSIHSQPYTHF